MEEEEQKNKKEKEDHSRIFLLEVKFNAGTVVGSLCHK